MAIWAFAGGGRTLADWTVILMAFNNVFFTTIAKWASQQVATPTGVGYE
ncbi:MAG: hypothetical protein Q4F56_02845 [Candidatus Saccharibacteria bacterium]|nr:hypothetical protein [Candidatus Saccharibacteria bacterium]